MVVTQRLHEATQRYAGARATQHIHTHTHARTHAVSCKSLTLHTITAGAHKGDLRRTEGRVHGVSLGTTATEVPLSQVGAI